MKKRAYLYVNYANIVVLKVYLDIIREALMQIDYECEYIKTLDGIPKSELIVFPMGKDAFRYYWKGYRNVILWQQGVTGAESYMRNHSSLRRTILNFMDCFAMRKAKMIFYVSETMKKYYEALAHTSFSEKAYIMPCFNEFFDPAVFEKKDYSRKIFTYVGSLDLWQCFDETVELFAEIERRIPEAFLKVLTFHTEKARQILESKGIKNYSVNCVPQEQVRAELEEAVFGFILRHDIDVNRVATPTKISSYLSAGVLPIYSSCLEDFHFRANGKTFAFAMDPGENAEKLTEYVSREIDPAVIRPEIEELFRTYYCAEKHTQDIAALASSCLC